MHGINSPKCLHFEVFNNKKRAIIIVEDLVPVPSVRKRNRGLSGRDGHANLSECIEKKPPEQLVQHALNGDGKCSICQGVKAELLKGSSQQHTFATLAPSGRRRKSLRAVEKGNQTVAQREGRKRRLTHNESLGESGDEVHDLFTAIRYSSPQNQPSTPTAGALSNTHCNSLHSIVDDGTVDQNLTEIPRLPLKTLHSGIESKVSRNNTLPSFASPEVSRTLSRP